MNDPIDRMIKNMKADEPDTAWMQDTRERLLNRVRDETQTHTSRRDGSRDGYRF